ncbi:MAG: DNA topoisomerase IB [Bacteroidota bacterium]|nr:DNA topoisomerase IB [Bacteroidota bacterium]
MSKSLKEIKLNKSIIISAVKDISQSAKAVNLVYISEQHLCIERAGKTKNFYYHNGGSKIEETEILERIKKLAIPPAWRNVRICKLANGHLQATGLDALNRKQYRYHNLWSVIRNHTKFYRLLDFGKQLPSIKTQLQKHLSLEGYPREKVLAAVVSLLQLTNIRVGNDSYEKLYGSFGLTTLKNRHVSLSESKLIFTFKGKKGIKHNITLRSKKLSRIVKGCKDIPGKDLFGYMDENGIVHDVDSGMVNEYIRTISGGDFTAKDFRTWAGSVEALKAFKETGGFENQTSMKQKINEAFEIVSKHLGNTKTVCKKYYVHPLILKLYEENKLEQYIGNMKITETDDDKSGLTSEEKVLMKVLEHSYVPVV